MNEAAQLAEHDHIVYLNDDLFMLSGTMVEPKDSGNPCVVVADHGDTVAAFANPSC